LKFEHRREKSVRVARDYVHVLAGKSAGWKCLTI